MNYIAHLNKVLNLFVQDFNLTPSHISLYMALFREWNYSRFSEQFSVQRKEVMDASKIGSKSTYHRCITDLHNSRYIIYNPSKNPHKGTEVCMSRFKTSKVQKKELYYPGDIQDTGLYSPGDVPDMELYNPSGVPAVGLYNPISVPVTIYKQINKKERRPISEHEVIKFFSEKDQNREQALKFFRYYEKKHWMTANNEAVKDWKSLAETWIINENQKELGKKASCFKDHLQTTKNKNYDQPL